MRAARTLCVCSYVQKRAQRTIKTPVPERLLYLCAPFDSTGQLCEMEIHHNMLMAYATYVFVLTRRSDIYEVSNEVAWLESWHLCYRLHSTGPRIEEPSQESY